MQLTDQQISDFQEQVWDHYHKLARRMPWRDNPEPYWVLVSELMLQQTQVSRVVPKFTAFIEQFPTLQSLAEAPLSEVLRAWSGLGYNRRAKFLHQAAQQIQTDSNGVIPQTLDQLIALSGIGKNTAGAILTYAFNRASPFIETNVRTVYFHHFFRDSVDVPDKEVLALVEQTLDADHPREWYWALMDYGTYLKQTIGNNIAQSKHYTKQSVFEGSRRQLRGKILKALLDRPHSETELAAALPDERLAAVLLELQQEHFVVVQDDLYKLTDQPKLP